MEEDRPDRHGLPSVPGRLRLSHQQLPQKPAHPIPALIAGRDRDPSHPIAAPAGLTLAVEPSLVRLAAGLDSSRAFEITPGQVRPAAFAPLDGLTLSQLKRILSEELVHWDEAGR